MVVVGVAVVVVVVVDCGWLDVVVVGLDVTVTGEFPLRADLTALINGYLPLFFQNTNLNESKYAPRKSTSS